MAATVRTRRPWSLRAPSVGVGAALALVVATVVALGIGAASVSPIEVARVVAIRVGLDVEPLPPLRDSLIWELRVPRVLLAAVVGASLAVCGTVLQALTRNPLAEPYLLGVSAGASTGAVFVVVLGVGSGVASMTIGAFVGALGAFAVVVGLMVRASTTSTARLVLTGVAVGQLFAAVTSLVLMAAADAQSTRGITFWLLGSLAGARWSNVALGGCVLLTVIGICWFAGPALDALTFGDDAASALGIPVGAVRWTLLVMTALLTAVVVSSVGAIGFVGLIVPHAVRLAIGSTNRTLLPVVALVGATFLVVADTVARTAFSPQEVPVGVVTAIVGVPVFLALMSRRTVA